MSKTLGSGGRSQTPLSGSVLLESEFFQERVHSRARIRGELKLSRNVSVVGADIGWPWTHATVPGPKSTSRIKPTPRLQASGTGQGALPAAVTIRAQLLALATAE